MVWSSAEFKEMAPSERDGVVTVLCTELDHFHRAPVSERARIHGDTLRLLDETVNRWLEDTIEDDDDMDTVFAMQDLQDQLKHELSLTRITISIRIGMTAAGFITRASCGGRPCAAQAR